MSDTTLWGMLFVAAVVPGGLYLIAKDAEDSCPRDGKLARGPIMLLGVVIYLSVTYSAG